MAQFYSIVNRVNHHRARQKAIRKQMIAAFIELRCSCEYSSLTKDDASERSHSICKHEDHPVQPKQFRDIEPICNVIQCPYVKEEQVKDDCD